MFDLSKPNYKNVFRIINVRFKSRFSLNSWENVSINDGYLIGNNPLSVWFDVELLHNFALGISCHTILAKWAWNWRFGSNILFLASHIGWNYDAIFSSNLLSSKTWNWMNVNSLMFWHFFFSPDSHIQHSPDSKYARFPTKLHTSLQVFERNDKAVKVRELWLFNAGGNVVEHKGIDLIIPFQYLHNALLALSYLKWIL